MSEITNIQNQVMGESAKEIQKEILPDIPVPPDPGTENKNVKIKI